MLTAKQIIEFGDSRGWKRLTSKSCKECAAFFRISEIHGGAWVGISHAYWALSRSSGDDRKMAENGAQTSEIIAAQSMRDSEELLSKVKTNAVGKVAINRQHPDYSPKVEFWSTDSIKNSGASHKFYVLLDDGEILFETYLRATEGVYWTGGPNLTLQGVEAND